MKYSRRSGKNVQRMPERNHTARTALALWPYATRGKSARVLFRRLVCPSAAVLWSFFSAPWFGNAGEKSLTVPFPEGVRAVDLAGKRVDPFLPQLAKGIVFIFVSVECPVSNSYMPEYRRLADEFTTNGIVFRLVFPNRDESAQVIRTHLEAFKCSLPALRDPDHQLVKVAKVRFTPEVALFAKGQGLVYHGRIDDRQVELGKTRPKATQHDLHEAIKAVLRGEIPKVRATRAVGCYIADPP